MNDKLAKLYGNGKTVTNGLTLAGIIIAKLAQDQGVEIDPVDIALAFSTIGVLAGVVAKWFRHTFEWGI